MQNKEGGKNQKLAQMLGMLTNHHSIQANIPEGSKSAYNQERYKFFLEAPFEISNKCCNVMKKNPAHDYGKRTGRKAITAQMASESRLRTQKWLQYGCNMFDAKYPVSNPMSFWTEQDVLQYIKENNIKIASVYGELVYDDGDQLTGQMDLADFGLAKEVRKLKTTKCQRTGCVFCGFGCHLEKNPNRFEMLRESHPQIYDYIMRPKEKGGLNYKEVLDWINEHGNMDIKY
jgi:3'-phosphoadenosine 5'-phosphosulfate sulfotransferase (PAPS reductase)/FAD synthetase